MYAKKAAKGSDSAGSAVEEEELVEEEGRAVTGGLIINNMSTNSENMLHASCYAMEGDMMRDVTRDLMFLFEFEHN